MANEPLLRPEEVASVLSSDDSDATPVEQEQARNGSTVYSLRKPVAIAPRETDDARERLERLAGVLQTALARDLETEVVIELQGFQQEQAAVAMETLPQPAWVLSFLLEQSGGMALALDPTCALSLVELALGGAGNTSATGRDPTALESRVLDKLCATLADPLKSKTGLGFRRGAFGICRLPVELAAPGQTLGVGLLKIRISGNDRSGLLLVSPNLLRTPRRTKGRPADSRPGPIARRLERVTLEARPVLGVGMIGLSDLTELAPGTVLRLEAPEERPLELRVAGQVLFRGAVTRDPEGARFHVSWRRGRPAAGADEEKK